MASKSQQSGLDIDLGNKCSKNAFGWAKKTFPNRENKAGRLCLGVDGAFSNMIAFGKQRIGISSDGIGTKIELAERTGIYHTLGFDLMAMVVDDLIAGGFVPTNISNILDVDYLDYETVNALMQGLHDAANATNVAVTGGEIAELGTRIGGWGKGMHFNWCSTAIGVLHPNLANPINGKQVQAGDAVIALQSRGFRSNGFSAIRRIMQANFGDTWHTQAYNNTHTWGEKLLSPSLIFAPFISHLLDHNIALKGIAHITGGGIADNFSRVLKVNKLGATLQNLFEPHEVMRKLWTLGNIPAEKAYLWWNMGNGMLFVVPQNTVEQVQALAANSQYNIKVAGHITAEPTITIKSNAVALQENYG